MGLGVFATRDIPKGTRIIDESPIFQFESRLEEDEANKSQTDTTITDDSYDDRSDSDDSLRDSEDNQGDDSNKNNNDVVEVDYDNLMGQDVNNVDSNAHENGEQQEKDEENDTFADSPLPATVFRFCDECLEQGLLDGKLNAMEGLSYSQSMYENPRIRELIRRFFFERVYPSRPDRAPLTADVLESKIRRFARLYAIRMRCQYSPHPSEYPGVPEAIYAMQARINHSCMPNAWHDFNGNTYRMTVHAVRDIRAGEQIFIAYGEYLRRSTAERNEELRRLDEIESCLCAMCLNPYTDELQAQLYRLYWGAFYFLYPDTRDPSTETMEFRAAHDAREALRMAQAVIEALKDPLINAETKVLADTYVVILLLVSSALVSKTKALTNLEFSARYRMCCFICQRLNDLDQAIVYAGLETSLQLTIRGIDNPNFKEADSRFKMMEFRYSGGI